ncbi:MAG: sugar phosphate isomerase/epimerase, partial [Dehalococcoidia bacterium]
VRLADNLGDKEVHLIPGQGNIDFASAFHRLESSGYSQYYCMNFGTLEDMVAARDYFAALG